MERIFDDCRSVAANAQLQKQNAQSLMTAQKSFIAVCRPPTGSGPKSQRMAGLPFSLTAADDMAALEAAEKKSRREAAASVMGAGLC